MELNKLVSSHVVVFKAVNEDYSTVDEIKEYFEERNVEISKSRIRHLLKDLIDMGKIKTAVDRTDSRRRFYYTTSMSINY